MVYWGCRPRKPMAWREEQVYLCTAADMVDGPLPRQFASAAPQSRRNSATLAGKMRYKLLIIREIVWRPKWDSNRCGWQQVRSAGQGL
jgi:hypothetical protein